MNVEIMVLFSVTRARRVIDGSRNLRTARGARQAAATV